MTRPLLKNLFSNQELLYFYEAVNSVEVPVDKFGQYIKDEDADPKVSASLGRLKASRFFDSMPNQIKDKLEKVAKEISGVDMSLRNSSYAEYSADYGRPDLPPHVDGDSNDMIINFQLSSNTVWELGLDLNTYRLEDNSAIIFNPNTTIHWRPKKTFNDGEYVKMIFFRLCDAANQKDYSHLPNDPDDKMFSEVVKFRDSLDI
jgi:hypothetical protein